MSPILVDSNEARAIRSPAPLTTPTTLLHKPTQHTHTDNTAILILPPSDHKHTHVARTLTRRHRPQLTHQPYAPVQRVNPQQPSLPLRPSHQSASARQLGLVQVRVARYTLFQVRVAWHRLFEDGATRQQLVEVGITGCHLLQIGIAWYQLFKVGVARNAEDRSAGDSHVEESEGRE